MTSNEFMLHISDKIYHGLPKSTDNWKMAQTLNCNSEFSKKKYTVLQITVKLDTFEIWDLATGSLESVSTEPANQGGHSESIQWFLLIVAKRLVSIPKPLKGDRRTDLISCGIGSVLSKPRATNPRMETKISDRPNMRNNMAWHRLLTTVVWILASAQ